MTVDPIYEGTEELGHPSGKLAGVVDTSEQFANVVAALKKAGFEHVHSLHGPDAINTLERLHGFFFMGDYEEEALKSHIAELKLGHYILIVAVDSDTASNAAAIAQSQGARYLVYFGLMVNTRLTK